MLASGAIMEEKSGFERPAYFLNDGVRYDIPKYDWHGSYGHEKNKNISYEETIAGDCTFEFSEHHEIVRKSSRNL